MSVGRWIFGSRAERERLLDMEARLRPMRRKTFVILGVGLICCAPWAGWWTLAPMAGAVLVYGLIERLVRRSKNPGILFGIAWVIVEAIIAVSVSLTGSLRDVTVCLLAIPVMTLNARFTARGIVIGGLLAVLAMAAVLLGGDPGAVLREPPILVAPVMLVVAWAMLSMPLMRSDIEHRRGTRIDGLTGMLTRAALSPRVEDFTGQSTVTGAPVAVILVDVDRFKGVNDSRGHPAGDTVLREVAYTLRKHVRAFEGVYRWGGDEFLVLLPGADLDVALEQAEKLRSAVASAFVHTGQQVTVSLGVAASRDGEVFDFEGVFDEADAALYEAKRGGRNRVRAASRDSERTATHGSVRLSAAQAI